MSKRFGRNQKRKMRAEISALIEMEKNVEAHCNYLRAQTAKARDIVRIVSEINPDLPSIGRARRFDGDVYAKSYAKMPSAVSYDSALPEKDQIIEIDRINLNQLRVDLIDCREFGRNVMFETNCGNLRYCVSLSDEALSHISVDDMAIHIARQIRSELDRNKSIECK